MPIFFPVFKITVTQEECNIKYILQTRETKIGYLSKLGRMYDKTGNVTYKRNIEARSPNHCCRGKAIIRLLHKYSDCVFVALVIQHAESMRRILLSSVACPALPYFFTLPQKTLDFRKKVLNKKCVFGFSLQLPS
jgi:hypothetical protein